MIIGPSPLSSDRGVRPPVRLHRTRIKLCVVGERGVGKTSLIRRYVRNEFRGAYHGTLGAQMYPLDVELPVDGGDLVLARVAIFDLMGEHSIRDAFRQAMFYDTEGVLAVCDVQRPETLYAIPEWIRAVSLVTNGVPFSIALNKVDRADAMAIGPKETAWLRETFPLVSTVMTSAATGSGVEAVFSGVINRAVHEQLAEDRSRHQARLLRHAILAFVSRKGSPGASKTDLFANFKTVMPASLVEELDHLVRLDLLRQEESGPKTFVKTASMPADFRFKSTPQGQKIAESPSMEELVVYESR